MDLLTRENFMSFFRNESLLNTLTPDDRVEIFSTILLGSSDITIELLNDLLVDYEVGNLSIIKGNINE